MVGCGHVQLGPAAHEKRFSVFLRAVACIDPRQASCVRKWLGVWVGVGWLKDRKVGSPHSRLVVKT